MPIIDVQKKYSTIILVRNFYVGISSWSRYVLDTLTGDNFLGAPALEACDGAVMVCVINEVNDRPVGNPKSKV
jgi:hypothetical protein